MLTLPAHGFYWFKLATDVPVPSWHEERLAREDLAVLILFDGWMSFFRERVVPWRIAMAEKVRAQLEEQVLPRYLQPQRWYAAKGESIKAARLNDHALWETPGGKWMLSMFNTEGTPEPASYFIPLTLAWEDTEEERMRALAPVTIAKVRQQAATGVLADAFGDENFCRAVAAAIGRGGEIATAKGVLRFTPTRAYAELGEADLAALPVGTPHGQSTNTIVTLGERLFLKGYRRLRAGVTPEVEIGRFLTDVAQFPNCVPLAGVMEHIAADGAATTLAVLQIYVRHQGDGWTFTLEYLARFFDTQGGRAPKCRPTSTALTSRSYRRWACARPSSTGRSRNAAAIRRSIPRRPARRTTRNGSAACATMQSSRSICLRSALLSFRPPSQRTRARSSSAAQRCSRAWMRFPSPCDRCSRRATTATIISARCCSPRTISC